MEAVTQIFPEEVNEGPKFTVIDVPELLTIVAPAGTDHAYDVAFVTEEIEYVTPDALHKEVPCPVIPPGCAGTEKIEYPLLKLPQIFDVVTVSVPEVQVGPKFTVHEAPLLEAIVAPPVIDQEYDVAP